MIKITTYKDAITQLWKIQGWSYITKEKAEEVRDIPGEVYVFEEKKIPVGFFKNYDNYCIRDNQITAIYPSVSVLDNDHPLKMPKEKERAVPVTEASSVLS